jgi:hypothetical protein
VVRTLKMGEVRKHPCRTSGLEVTELGDRLLGFGGCLLGAAVCFFVAFLTLPLLALRPAKFALAFRCASLSYMSFLRI